MKHLILAASMLVATVPAMAADVAMSVTIGDPNFYGRIDIGNFPQPQLVNVQPVIIRQPAHVVVGSPLYLRVPPGHNKKWSKHCGKYNACGQQVYFVQDNWYSNVYAPQYRERHGKGHGHGDQGKDHGGHGKDKDKDHGKGHGKGNDKH
jgi:hypothetical protein